MRSSALTSRLSAPLCKKSTFTPNLPIFPVRHHSSTAPTARAAPSSIHSFRPRAPLQPSNLPIRCLSSPRYNSTATSTVDGASTSSATTAPVIPAITPLSWTDFFALRKRRRVTNLITSSLTGSMSLFVGAAFLSGAELDNLGAQKFGVDPFIFAGILTMACGSLGWLVGPFIGNTVWRMANRGRVTGFELVSWGQDVQSRAQKTWKYRSCTFVSRISS